MLQQIIFADGTALDVAVIKGQTTYHQGMQRDSLEIQIAKDAISFDALDALTADSTKTDRLTIVTQEGDQQTQKVYDHYVVRTKLELRTVDIISADGTPTGISEDRYCVTLAQLTYAEIQQAAQAAAIADMQAAITALAFGGEA
nr:MAG TPA: hypothetical protein [Caudoviricetes sp.]